MANPDGSPPTRRWPWLVVGALLFAVVLFAADRVLNARAENRIEQLVAEQFPADGLTVRIGGALLLPQYLSGSLDRVDIAADALEVGGLGLTEVDVLVTDVTVAEPHTAGGIEFAATIPESTIQAALDEVRLPIDVSLAVERDLVVARTTFLGLDAEIGMSLVANGRSISTRIETMMLGGIRIDAVGMPGGLIEALSRIEVPILGLPDGITLTTVTMLPDGFRVAGAGTDVRFDN